VTFVLGDHLNKPDCDVLTCDEIEGTYFHLDGGLVSFVEHDDSNHVTVLVRDPRDGTIIDDDSRIPTVILKIPGKLFFKVEFRTSVTFKL